MKTNHDNEIMNALRMEGVDAEQIVVTKNGIPCKGIRIITGDGEVCPVVYYSEEETASEFVARVRGIMAAKTPVIRTHEMTDWNYVKKNIFLSLAKRSGENIVKRPYLNLELQIRLRMDLGASGTGTVKITKSLIDTVGIPEEDFWREAEKNTADAACVCSMMELLGLDNTGDDDMLYVATTHLPGGASVLYLPELFRQYCEEHEETECYILPSSTEEVIIVAGSNVGRYMDVSELACMVRQINADQVDPVIQLEPAAYRYSADSDTVELVCKAEEVL